MKINYYDRLFYVFYKFYRSNFGSKELPVYTSIMVLGMYMYSWLLFILISIVKLFGLNVTLRSVTNVFFATLLFGAVFLFQSLYFYRKSRFLKIIRALRNLDVTRVNLHFIILVPGSVAVFILYGYFFW